MRGRNGRVRDTPSPAVPAVGTGAGTGAGGGAGGGGASAPASPPQRLEGEFNPSSSLGDAGAKLVLRRMAKEQRVRQLTKREEIESVGDWLFGPGGIRGLRVNPEGILNRDGGGAGGVVHSGLVMNLPAGASGTKSSSQGPSRLDLAMEKYMKTTAEAQKRGGGTAKKAPAPGSTTLPRRSAATGTLKTRAVLFLKVAWARLSKCVGTCCNGPSQEDDTRNDAPVILGGVYRKVAEIVGVTQTQLKMLRRAFQRIDFDGIGNITMYELFKYLREPVSPVMERLYTQLIASQPSAGVDENGVKTLNFDCFVLYVIVFGTMTERDILRFVFETFDVDGSGHLDEDEVRALLTVVNHDRPLYPGNFAKTMRDFDTDGDGRLSFKEFIALHKKFPSALFPAFRLQDNMHIKTLGQQAFVVLQENTTGRRKAAEARSKEMKRMEGGTLKAEAMAVQREKSEEEDDAHSEVKKSQTPARGEGAASPSQARSPNSGRSKTTSPAATRLLKPDS